MSATSHIKVVCKSCSSKLTAPSVAVGKVLICPNCGARVLVPGVAQRVEQPPQQNMRVEPETSYESTNRSNGIRILIGVTCFVICVAVFALIFVGYSIIESDDHSQQTTVATNPAVTETPALQQSNEIESASEETTLNYDTSEKEQPEAQPASESFDDLAEQSDTKIRMIEGSDIGLEDVERMIGREWIKLGAADRKAVEYTLSLILVLADQNLDAEGIVPISTFLDSYYKNAGNRDTLLYSAADAYLEE